MSYYKSKNVFSKIISFVLFVATIIGAVALINHFVSNKADDDGLVEINPIFEIGGLTESGKYEETKESLYTNKAFECLGLEVKLEFDSTINYQIFFYDDLGNFVSSSGVLTEHYTDDIPNGVSHARIEITPVWEDDVDEEEKELNIFQIRKYVKQLTIKVLEEQNKIDLLIEDLEENYEKVDLLVVGQGTFDVENGSNGFEEKENSPWYFYNVINVTSEDYLVLKLPIVLLKEKVIYSETEYGAFIYYDITNKQSSLANYKYEEVGVKGNYTYIKFDVENVDEFVFAVNESNVDNVSCWVK